MKEVSAADFDYVEEVDMAGKNKNNGILKKWISNINCFIEIKILPVLTQNRGLPQRNC